jgi:hypothetical protein
MNTPKRIVLVSSIATLLAGCASGGGGSGGGGSSGGGGGPGPSIFEVLNCYVNGVCGANSGSSDASGTPFIPPALLGVAPHSVDSMVFATQEQTTSYEQGAKGQVTRSNYADESGKLQSTLANLAQAALPGFDVTYSKTPSTGGNVSSPFMPQAAAMELAANPSALGWNYQSFGVWDQHNASSASYVTSRSYGVATPASSVPTTGNATFSGKLGGLYVSPTGQGSIASADVSVNANFSARSLSFASAGTTTTQDLKASAAAPNLNLSGTLTYSPGSNGFSGVLTNAGGTMSGPSKGQFYGPAAQEIGGVFAVKSATTVETFTGGFGGKR